MSIPSVRTAISFITLGRTTPRSGVRVTGLVLLLVAGMTARSVSAEKVTAETWAKLGRDYAGTTRVLMTKYCYNCHASPIPAGDLDLKGFESVQEIREDIPAWLDVHKMLTLERMPPDEAPQPSAAERQKILGWVERYFHAEAYANGGDPGPVVLRRLNNAQYTDTIRDLTELEKLNPARTFPSDSAAGEGFTNVGGALAMSDALFTKYLDAAKRIASHAVLTPDGFRFSEKTTRRDWTNDLLAEIREIYHRYAIPRDEIHVQLQGVGFERSKGGQIPLKRYLTATIEERQSLESGAVTIEAVARERNLNTNYLRGLWTALNDKDASLLLARLGRNLRSATPADVPALVKTIQRWQVALTGFQSVGHQQNWMVPKHPLQAQQEIRYEISASPSQEVVTLYLQTSDAGDGGEDAVVWQRPRFVSPGRPDLLLRDVRAITARALARRKRLFAASEEALLAAAEARAAGGNVDLAALAKKHGLERDILAAWFSYLGIGAEPATSLPLFKEQIERSGDYEFIQGWGSLETPQILANSSDQLVRIPGTMKPHSVVVHPTPSQATIVGWRSPIAGTVTIAATITDAHVGCGNGVSWALEVHRGASRWRLASGTTAGATPAVIEPIENLSVREGDLLSLTVGPRDGNHACDLTDVALTITSQETEKTEWSLRRGVSADILAGNPHADRFGHENVWYFYTEPVSVMRAAEVIPAGSLLAQWYATSDPAEQKALAAALGRLLADGPTSNTSEADSRLYRELRTLSGLLVRQDAEARPAKPLEGDALTTESPTESSWGLDPGLFGTTFEGAEIDAASLRTMAPGVLEVRLPADLVRGRTFVATASLAPHVGSEDSAQVRVSTKPPGEESRLRPNVPILVREESTAAKRFHTAFQDFRHWFPAALCYTKIVPTDQVITLTLFHREDGPLCELMLSDEEKARLDRLWEELHFVSRDALEMVDVYEQLLEYATQGGDKRAYLHFRKPIEARAAAFRQTLQEARPKQLASLVDFAALVFRRPLAEKEKQDLRGLYQELRADGLAHENAFRLTLAKLFVSPAFLYRLEDAPSGTGSVAVSDWEMASRLSYFLTSSMPDAELRALAAAGKLQDPDVLAAQAQRLLQAPTVRRLAEEFGCQWLQIYHFDSFNNKNPQHFPGFNELRDDMYEEAIRLFAHLFRRDQSILSLIDGDAVIVNQALAEHYGIPGVTEPGWHRIENARQYKRGGILGLAAVLSKQAGASKTSPILRGAWVSDVLLGRKLPPPPDGVNPFSAGALSQDLTMRQITALHTNHPQCAACHVRIDPLGFSLAEFDAIGRFRTQDAAGRPINAKSELRDGTKLDGIDGLLSYIAKNQREAFVKEFCRMLLGYALGREILLTDRPLINRMSEKLEQNDYRVSIAVEMIVRSRQFREIRAANWDAPESPVRARRPLTKN